MSDDCLKLLYYAYCDVSHNSLMVQRQFQQLVVDAFKFVGRVSSEMSDRAADIAGQFYAETKVMSVDHFVQVAQVEIPTMLEPHDCVIQLASDTKKKLEDWLESRRLPLDLVQLLIELRIGNSVGLKRLKPDDFSRIEDRLKPLEYKRFIRGVEELKLAPTAEGTGTISPVVRNLSSFGNGQNIEDMDILKISDDSSSAVQLKLQKLAVEKSLEILNCVLCQPVIGIKKFKGDVSTSTKGRLELSKQAYVERLRRLRSLLNVKAKTERVDDIAEEALSLFKKKSSKNQVVLRLKQRSVNVSTPPAPGTAEEVGTQAMQSVEPKRTPSPHPGTALTRGGRRSDTATVEATAPASITTAISGKPQSIRFFVLSV